MTIDEAIIYHVQKADSYHKAMPNYDEAADHRQLAEWLTELKEAKRLLKSAVEDINWINEHTQDDDGSCIMRTNSGCSGCPLDINGDLFCKWKHSDEALKLIEKGEQL